MDPEKRQGCKIAGPEEVAFDSDFIDAGQLERVAASLGNGNYGTHVRNLLRDHRG